MAAGLDILDALARFECELVDRPPETRRDFILAILGRWQGDPDLNESSRQRAREILRRFGRVV
jgi:hypothetical protein